MSLTENIKTVVATVEELATAIEEKGVTVPECASFTEYPDLIRKIEGEEIPLKSHSTVFAFTESEDIPDISALSNVTYSPDTGADFSNAKEWSSGQFVKFRSITEPIVWESHAIFNSDGENTTGWSVPIRKTGKDGINGESIKGDKGDQGESGKDGIDGKDGISAELIYKRVSDSSIQVEAPSSYDLDKYQPEGWTLFPQGVDVNYQVEYVCQREKIDGEWGNYSNPAIWAMYGAIGKDGNGIEYIYKLSEDRPDTPVAPDTTGLLNESFPPDWSDDPLSVTEVNTICWVSTRKQSYINDVQKWGEYSVPAIWSKFGKDGLGGGRTVFVYTGTDTTDVPITPEGGSWNSTTNEIIPPTGSDGALWMTNTDEVSGKYIWISTGSFDKYDRLIGNWTIPIRITGDSGENGVDGVSIEFIYRLVPNYDKYIELKDWQINNPLENTEQGVVPENSDLDENQICDSKWTDVPSGINNINFAIEVVCVRTYHKNLDSGASEWSNWSEPTLWSKWGEDGIDGAGIEYIYIITPEMIDGEPVTGEYVMNNLFPVTPLEMMNHESYQEPEFCPNENFGYDGYNWTDEPSDVSSSEPLEWVSIRKQRLDGNILKWGAFSTPKLWNRYASDGINGTDGKDGVDGIDGAPGIDGVGISEIIKRYELGNDPQNHPEFSESSTTDPSILITNYNTARYIWCQETTIYTDGNSIIIYYIVTVHGEPGANGTRNDAPIIYPAGVWNADKEYIAESNKVPYVFYAVDGKYYMLNSKELIIGEGEGSGWKGSQYAPGTMYEEEPIWTEIESFEAIYSDIGLFNQALVGKWVFHGDYMFSQQGKDNLDVEKWYYDYNDPASAISNGDFIPNICMNTVDGSAYFAGFTIDEDGFSYSKDGQFAHISSTGIEYSNSDANSYFKLDNNGNATFSSGSVKFNGDGSGSINNGTLEWDEAGNIIKCNLYSKETVSGADYYTPTFGPNTTHYLFVYSADNSLVAINLPDLDENVLTAMGDGVYYGTLVITNRNTNDLEVTMNLNWDDRDYPESVILKSGRSVRINYFNDFQDYYVVQGFIEQSA